MLGWQHTQVATHVVVVGGGAVLGAAVHFARGVEAERALALLRRLLLHVPASDGSIAFTHTHCEDFIVSASN